MYLYKIPLPLQQHFSARNTSDRYVSDQLRELFSLDFVNQDFIRTPLCEPNAIDVSCFMSVVISFDSFRVA